jgi:hypothetical protein
VKLFFDIEATGRNAYASEIIEMYLLREDGLDYHFKSKVKKWSVEAETIHKIPKAEMLTYPEKNKAWNNLLNWLPSEFELICHANPQSELGYLLYDVVMFKYELLNHLNLYREDEIPLSITSFSTHSLAKECARLGYFTPIRNPETNRASFTQDNVYKALFGELPKVSHRAKDDVLSMKKIYDYLIELKDSGNKLANNLQMSLL